MKKTLGHLLLGLLVVLALPACNIAEKYARNNKAADEWLASNAGSSYINVSGRWHAEGWGGALLTQKGNKITGTIGNYTVSGVVKGSTVYLALSSDNWVYYTAKARRTSSGTLDGYYSHAVPYSESDQASFTLTRPKL